MLCLLVQQLSDSTAFLSLVFLVHLLFRRAMKYFPRADACAGGERSHFAYPARATQQLSGSTLVNARCAKTFLQGWGLPQPLCVGARSFPDCLRVACVSYQVGMDGTGTSF